MNLLVVTFFVRFRVFDFEIVIQFIKCLEGLEVNEPHKDDKVQVIAMISLLSARLQSIIIRRHYQFVMLRPSPADLLIHLAVFGRC